jgi:hypothetical protein
MSLVKAISTYLASELIRVAFYMWPSPAGLGMRGSYVFASKWCEYFEPSPVMVVCKVEDHGDTVTPVVEMGVHNVSIS